MSLIDITAKPVGVREFQAHVLVHQHATTIQKGYNSTAQIGSVT